MNLVVIRKFDAAHRLYDYKGICSNLHGHTWKVVFYIQVPETISKIEGYYENITIDFKELKEKLDSILPDHKFINNEVGFNPTAENLTIYLKEKAEKLGLNITKIQVWESDACGVEF